MKKGIMAMEGLEDEVPLEDAPPALPEPSEEPTGEVIATEIVEGDELNAEAEAVGDAFEEADDIEGALGGMVESCEAVQAEGRDFTAPEAQMVETALEHYRARLGFAKPKILAFENLPAGKKKVDVALEGIKDTIKSTLMTKVSGLAWIGEAVTNQAENHRKVVARLKQELSNASAQYDKGGKDHSAVLSGAWTAELNSPTGEAKTGKDVNTNFKNYLTYTLNPNHSKVVTESVAAVGNVLDVIRSVWFMSNKADISKLDGALESLRSNLKSVAFIKLSDGNLGIPIGIAQTTAAFVTDDDEPVLKIKKNMPAHKSAIKALEPSEKQALENMVNKLLSDEVMSKGAEQLREKVKSTYGYTTVNRNIRLPAAILSAITYQVYEAQDLRRAMSVTMVANGIRAYFAEEMKVREKVAAAAIAYIRASTSSGDRAQAPAAK